MENSEMKLKKVKGNLVIEVPLDPQGWPSKSQKTTLLYSSRGFQWSTELGLGVSINVVKSKKVKAKAD